MVIALLSVVTKITIDVARVVRGAVRAVGAWPGRGQPGMSIQGLVSVTPPSATEAAALRRSSPPPSPPAPRSTPAAAAPPPAAASSSTTAPGSATPAGLPKSPAPPPAKDTRPRPADETAAAVTRPWTGRGRGRRHIFDRMACGRGRMPGAGWNNGSPQKLPTPAKPRPPLAPPASDCPPAMRWCYLIGKAIRNRRAASRALAEMWSKNMPKRLDTKRPYGPTIQGQRWGWREIRSFW